MKFVKYFLVFVYNEIFSLYDVSIFPYSVIPICTNLLEKNQNYSIIKAREEFIMDINIEELIKLLPK